MDIDRYSPFLGTLYRRWFDLRQGARWPRREQFDPVDFAPALGTLSLMEVQRNPLRFKYRVHGTDTARWVGYELTGKFVDDAPNKELAAKATEHFTQVVITGEPSYYRHFNHVFDGRLINIEALVLPLSSHGHCVDFLINVVVPHAGEVSWRAQRPHKEIFVFKNGEIIQAVCSSDAVGDAVVGDFTAIAV